MFTLIRKLEGTVQDVNLSEANVLAFESQ
jgi:hypothetical protein